MLVNTCVNYKIFGLATFLSSIKACAEQQLPNQPFLRGVLTGTTVSYIFCHKEQDLGSEFPKKMTKCLNDPRAWHLLLMA